MPFVRCQLRHVYFHRRIRIKGVRSARLRCRMHAEHTVDTRALAYRLLGRLWLSGWQGRVIVLRMMMMVMVIVIWMSVYRSVMMMIVVRRDGIAIDVRRRVTLR